MKRKLMAVMVIFLLVLVSLITSSAPPTPHNIRGRVFYIDGVTGVDNGIPIRINNTNNSNSVLTQVYAPQIPTLKGTYAATINGSDNDFIIARAWNLTHYGENSSLLQATTTTMNIVLNTIRPSETNVTILTITNHSSYNLTELTQISATIAILGNNGVNCIAALNISDISTINISKGETYSHSLGDISLGSDISTTWYVTGLDEGSFNITVKASCDSDGINLEDENIDIRYNLSIKDTAGPYIQLMYPSDDSVISFRNNPVTFEYNATDESEIINCNLVLNGSINLTNSTIQKNVSQIFIKSLTVGAYNWSIQCMDNSTARNIGYSPTFNLNITPNNAPILSDFSITDPIDLTIGGIKIVLCNATVTDNDNITDIAGVNATLYHSSSTYNSSDDNNDHYTNTSCKLISSTQYTGGYSCSFPMQYYSNNGSWTCNLTVIDLYNDTDSVQTDTTVNDLIALNLSTSLIDFGNLAVGNTSPEDVNLTIANLGNKDINITLKGYGVSDGDGLAMECAKDNISIGYERYSTSFGKDYSAMTNLTSGYQQIINFTLPQRTNDTYYGSDRNATYWKISIPLGVNGKCNGSITVLAIST